MALYEAFDALAIDEDEETQEEGEVNEGLEEDSVGLPTISTTTQILTIPHKNCNHNKYKNNKYKSESTHTSLQK